MDVYYTSKWLFIVYLAFSITIRTQSSTYYHPIMHNGGQIVFEVPFELSLFIQRVTGHSSLLRTFGLNATSTYDSYLPLTFGEFALI